MYFIRDPLIATIIAQTLGLFLSMYFTIDIWWLKVTKEIKFPISIRQRINFLGIGSISAIFTSYSVGIISNFRFLTISEVLVTNWIVLATIAIFKYLFFKKTVIRMNP